MAAAAADNASIDLDDALHRDGEFLREFWALYFLGVAIIVLRFPVRIRMVGFKGLAPDDYTLTTWLSCMTLVERVHTYGTNVDVTQDIVDRFSQSDIDRLTYGSKCQQAAWYCYTALLWSMKATILLFYYVTVCLFVLVNHNAPRLTYTTSKRLIGQIWHANVFRGLAWVTGLSYCAVVLTISLSCRPSNWQVDPLPSYQCTFKLPNLVSTTALNILTDAAILILPTPLLKELNVAPIKKIFVMLLLCSGLFVIGAAIMRLVNTLGGEPSTVTVNRWGVRECVVGVTAINAPVFRPVFTIGFWRNQPRRDSGPRPMDDHLAHPPQAELANRGFYKDSVLGWMKSRTKSTITTAKTWGTTGTTAVTQHTLRRGDEESGLALRGVRAEPPPPPLPTNIQGGRVEKATGVVISSQDTTDEIGRPPPRPDRPTTSTSPRSPKCKSLSYVDSLG